MMMNNESELICIQLTKDEFDLIKFTLVPIYNELKKFPTKFRTPKFYRYEKLVNEIFKD